MMQGHRGGIRMPYHIITEEEADADLIRDHLTAENWKNFEVVACGSKMRTISYAKTVSVNGNAPAAVVLKAYTKKEQQLRIMHSEFHDLVQPLPRSIAPILLFAHDSVSEALKEKLKVHLETFLSGESLDEFQYIPR